MLNYGDVRDDVLNVQMVVEYANESKQAITILHWYSENLFDH